MPFLACSPILAGMSGQPGTGSQDRAYARGQRDAAISRVGRTRRWLIIGAAGLSAALAALASALTPGRSVAAKTPARTVAATSPAPSGSAANQPLPPEASPSSLGLQSPSQAPQSAPAQAPSQVSPDPSQVSPDPSQVSPDPSQVSPDPSQVGPAQQAAPAPAPVTSGGS